MVKLSPAFIWINDVEIPNSNIPRPVKITHGRSKPGVQPDAPTLDFEYLGSVAPCEVGDRVKVLTKKNIKTSRWVSPDNLWFGDQTSWGGAMEYEIRFTGTIISAKATEQNGQVVSWSYNAVGLQARLGLIHAYLERPYETDMERVLAISNKVGVPVGRKGVDTIDLAADIIDRPALEAFQELCKSTGGLFWQDADGSLWYGGADHREGQTSWVIPAAAILDGIEWDEGTDDLLNALTLIHPQEPLPPLAPNGKWTWKAGADTGADPGNGNFVTNATNAGGVTTIAISDKATGGDDMTNSLKRRDVGTIFYLQTVANADKWVRYTLTGAAEDNGGWFTLTVESTEISKIGLPAAGEACLLTFDSRDHDVLHYRQYQHDESIAKWGYRHQEIETLVADDETSIALANIILVRRAFPFWSANGILIPVDEISTADQNAVEALRISNSVTIPLTPYPDYTPGPLTLWAVEGWVEEWREDGRWMQLALTDWERSSSSSIRTWDEVKVHTWDTMRGQTYRDILVEHT